MKSVNDPSLMQTLEAEVGHEASPLLAFLTRNVKLFVLLFILFLAGITGYFVYGGMKAKDSAAAVQVLGKILMINEAEQRYTALEEYLKTVPQDMKGEGLLALATTALEAGKYEVAGNIWDEVSKKYPELKVQATFGKVKSLKARGMKDEALSSLEALIPSLEPKSIDLFNVNTEIASLAETMKNYPRAIAAYQALITSASPADPSSNWWRQKLAALTMKQKNTTEVKE